MQDPRSTSRHIMVRDLPHEKTVKDDYHEGKGEVVSYALWNYFVGRKEEDGNGDTAYYEEWPSDVNKDAIKVLFDKGRKKREETMGNGDYARTYDILCHFSRFLVRKHERRMTGFNVLNSTSLNYLSVHSFCVSFLLLYIYIYIYFYLSPADLLSHFKLTSSKFSRPYAQHRPTAAWAPHPR